MQCNCNVRQHDFAAVSRCCLENCPKGSRARTFRYYHSSWLVDLFPQKNSSSLPTRARLASVNEESFWDEPRPSSTCGCLLCYAWIARSQGCYQKQLHFGRRADCRWRICRKDRRWLATICPIAADWRAAPPMCRPCPLIGRAVLYSNTTQCCKPSWISWMCTTTRVSRSGRQSCLYGRRNSGAAEVTACEDENDRYGSATEVPHLQKHEPSTTSSQVGTASRPLRASCYVRLVA
jgi:hypothetical protein